MSSKLFKFCILAASMVLYNCSADNSSGQINSTEVYRAESPYAKVLQECVQLKTFEDSCLISKLPFIGNGVDIPTVNQIMERVIVDEPWMGERFEDILRQAPDDIRLLMSSITAIELVANTPGNMYRIWSGSLRMSAHPLWITDSEKSTLDFSDNSDSRFATNLLFRHPWSNSLDGISYDEFNRRTSSRQWNGSRDFNLIFLSFLDGLYHELGHAASYLNLNELSQVDENQSAVDVTYYNGTDLSQTLAEQNPLNIDTMRPLAKSYYAQTEAPLEIESLTASEVAALFNADGAVELYSYFSDGEDLATLFAATMMKYHFNAQKTVGFSIKPEITETCSTFILVWGANDRLSNPTVANRAKYVADLVFSDRIDFNAFFRNLPQDQRTIPSDTSWCDSRDG